MAKAASPYATRFLVALASLSPSPAPQPPISLDRGQAGRGRSGARGDPSDRLRGRPGRRGLERCRRSSSQEIGVEQKANGRLLVVARKNLGRAQRNLEEPDRRDLHGLRRERRPRSRCCSARRAWTTWWIGSTPSTASRIRTRTSSGRCARSGRRSSGSAPSWRRPIAVRKRSSRAARRSSERSRASSPSGSSCSPSIQSEIARLAGRGGRAPGRARSARRARASPPSARRPHRRVGGGAGGAEPAAPFASTLVEPGRRGRDGAAVALRGRRRDRDAVPRHSVRLGRRRARRLRLLRLRHVRLLAGRRLPAAQRGGAVRLRNAGLARSSSSPATSSSSTASGTTASTSAAASSSTRRTRATWSRSRACPTVLVRQPLRRRPPASSLSSGRARSISSAKCSCTTRRLSFSVGVISPSSGEKSRGRIANRLICSCRERSRLTVVDDLAAPRPAGSAASSIAARPPRPRLDRDQRREVRPPVADDERLRDERRRLEHVLDVLRRDVLAAGGDDDVLLAVGDAEEAVGVELADVAGAEPAVARRAPRASPPRPCSSRRRSSRCG